MRNRLKRRWREAFKEALLRRGYENDGSRALIEAGKNLKGGKVVGLRGNLQILIVEGGGWEESMDWLVGIAGRVVEALEGDRFGRGEKGGKIK